MQRAAPALWMATRDRLAVTSRSAGGGPDSSQGRLPFARRLLLSLGRGRRAIERGLRDLDARDASLYQQIFESSPAAMALIDRSLTIVGVNAALSALLEREAAEICGQDVATLSAPPHPPRLRLMAQKAASQDGTVVVEHRLARTTGEGWARTSLRRLGAGDSDVALVVVVEDMTSDQEALEQQRREAELDPLTGLLNRRGGDRRLRAALGQMAQHGPVAVIACDADGFKEINDRYGHAAGDEVLAGIAGRLRSAIRFGDDVARLGGDEFIIVAWVADEAEAESIASRCVSTVAEPFRTSKVGGPHQVTLSAGVAVVHPGERIEAEALIDGADRALYQAKNAGGNRWVLASGVAGGPPR